MKRMRMAVLGLAAVFVVATSAFGYAQVGENHGADVSEVATSDATSGSDHGAAVSEVAKSNVGSDESDSAEAGERKLNHGYYVSKAAKCEDVDDAETEGEAFTAPEDCTGSARGEYVASVAKSSIGKKAKPENGED